MTDASNRRLAPRCPTCQGPAKLETNAPDGIRCRNSTCTHNHQHISCPRCGSAELSHVQFEDGIFTYTCVDCTRTFKKGEKAES